MLKTTYRPAPETSALPEGWTEHTAPTGHKYYYNASTKHSTYTRPVAEAESEPLQIDYNATQPDLEVRASLLAQEEFQRNQDVQGPAPQQRQPRRRHHGGDRPKSKAPIPNCQPWILVKTKFGRRFVHNTETKQSLWKFPQDVMMAVIEMDRMEWEAKRKQQDQAEQEAANEVVKGDVVSQANAAAKEQEEDSDSYEEVEVTDEEEDLSAKRPRLSSTDGNGTGPVEFDEEDIEWQLAQMQEDDLGDQYAEEEEEGLPVTEDDNIALFRSLLDDFHISPYAEFDKLLENDAIVEDQRYTALPNTHRRREVFLDWSRDRISETQDRQKLENTKKTDPKVKYLQFLQKNATPKLFWPEFKRKFKKEPEMKDYEPPDKDKEKLYRELVPKLKLSESDRRRELVALLKSTAPGRLTRQGTVNTLPDVILKDLRYYLVDDKKRSEMVEGFIATL